MQRKQLEMASGLSEDEEIPGGDILGEEPPSEADGDIAKWLMGDKEDFTSWVEGSKPGSAEAVPLDRPDSESKIIEAWLRGKVTDITSWLTTEGETQSLAGEHVAIQERVGREELERAAAELQELVTDFKAGRIRAEDIANKTLDVISDLESVKLENSRLKEELEGVRKGSTALAKYFKSMQGKGDIEADEIADNLAKEMATREQMELENLKLKSSIEIYKDQLEKGLSELPDEQVDLKRLQIELAEREQTIMDMQEFLKEKEKCMEAEESDSRTQMRERFSAELQDRISDFEKREVESKAEIERLTFKTRDLEVSIKQKNDEIEMMAQAAGGKGLDSSFKEKLADMQRLERQLALRNEEVGMMREKLETKEDEMKALKEPMRYKEDEMLRREEDLMHRERVLEEELKRLEQAKTEMGSQSELELKKRLEQLQSDITQKEEEIKAKEKYLSSKEEELKLREQGVIGQEIEKREEERALEFKIEKVKTGTSRLDDLLMGGLPFGTNVLVYGPPFLGKEALVNTFVAEGLAKGIPVIWVTTEKTPNEIREEMKFIVSGFEEYEKLGLVGFVDSYSRSMGDQSTDETVTYIESPTDFQSIQKAVDEAAKKMLEEHKYYRFVFRSISTMIAYLDPATAFRFLNPIAGRRKRDKAVSMFLIEKGMHGDQEIQMVGSLMDGMIEFKVENLNTFLSIKGIGDVQSRAWIRYTASKSGVNIGSFALDHIR